MADTTGGSSYDHLAGSPMDVNDHPDNSQSFKGTGYSSYDSNTKTFWLDNKDGSISPSNTSVGQTVTDAMRRRDNQDRFQRALTGTDYNH